MPEELTPLDSVEEPTWRALARFFVAAPRLLDEDLQRGAHLSLSSTLPCFARAMIAIADSLE